jgi:hypothetical protein
MPLYRQAPTFATVLRSFGSADGLPFADVLTEEDIQAACDAEGVHFGQGEHDIWTPAFTLWAFLAQCLSASKSCVSAVARVLVLRIALGLTPCSAGTGAYCKARAKFPETFLCRLTLHIGVNVEDEAPDDWRWHDRRVILVDGFEGSMPDTQANQQAYPALRHQRAGLTFPHLRVVVLLAYATGCLLGAALGPVKGKGTGETELFRTLLGQLRRGDVVVADRYYCTWWLVALLQARDVEVCFRLHHLRKYDFRRGRRLGKGDHVVSWPRPPRPDWMDAESYACLPRSLEMREVRVVVSDRGCRVRSFVAATTLLEEAEYSAADIGDLYHQRWHAELDIRAIKVTLNMDILSCKTPEMVRKEVWAHLLVYNLVRKVLAQAALAGDVVPRQLSFAAAVQTLDAFRWLLVAGSAGPDRRLVEALLLALRVHVVGNRPGRVEPRENKRRPKGKRMMKPRAQRRAELLRGKKERKR